MLRHLRWLPIAAAVLSTGVAHDADAATPGFTIEIEGTQVELKYGTVVRGANGGLRIELRNEDLGCDKKTSPSKNIVSLSFHVRRGTSGDFLVGSKHGVLLGWHADSLASTRRTAPPDQTVLKVDPFKLVAGNKITGDLQFDVEGVSSSSRPAPRYRTIWTSFQATICKDSLEYEGIPSPPPPGSSPLAGKVGGKAFRFPYAVAIVRSGGSNPKHLDEIRFYEHEKVGCAGTTDVDSKSAIFTVNYIGGSSVSHPLSGPQPAIGQFSSGLETGPASAWFYDMIVESDWDKQTSGQQLTGTVSARNAASELKGTFKAKICPG